MGMQNLSLTKKLCMGGEEKGEKSALRVPAVTNQTINVLLLHTHQTNTLFPTKLAKVNGSKVQNTKYDEAKSKRSKYSTLTKYRR